MFGSGIDWPEKSAVPYEAILPTGDTSGPDEKTKDSGGSLGWTLWMLCIACITRKYGKMATTAHNPCMF